MDQCDCGHARCMCDIEICLCGHSQREHGHGHPHTSQDPVPESMRSGVMPHRGRCYAETNTVQVCGCRHFCWSYDKGDEPEDQKLDDDDLTPEAAEITMRRDKILAIVRTS